MDLARARRRGQNDHRHADGKYGVRGGKGGAMTSERMTLSVAQLNEYVRRTLASDVMLKNICKSVYAHPSY